MLNKKGIFLVIGSLGSLVSLVGLSQSSNLAPFFYVVGAILLFSTAVYFKLIYFIALEIILIAGHSAKLLGIGSILQVAIPVLLCVQLSVFYLLSGRLNNIFLIIGITGIATLSIGLSYEDQWVFFFGSTATAIYAYYYSSKKPVALIWAIMNTIFAIIAIIKIILFYS